MANEPSFDDLFDVFFGETTSAHARVYARLPRGDWPDDARLFGTIRGPHCHYAQTLPASYRFVDRGPGDTILAEAIVPDPCFWTPAMPYLYNVQIELRQGSRILASVSRPFGIRPLGTRGRNLVFSGKRWVLRGATRLGMPDEELTQWHAVELAALLQTTTQAVVEKASNLGVMTACFTGGSEANMTGACRWASRHPSIALVVVNSTEAQATKALPTIGNLLRATFVSLDEPLQANAWTDLVIGEVGDAATFVEKYRECPVPVIASRLNHALQSPEDIRSGCDRLQRDLAPFGDYAGYIV